MTPAAKERRAGRAWEQLCCVPTTWAATPQHFQGVNTFLFPKHFHFATHTRPALPRNSVPLICLCNAQQARAASRYQIKLFGTPLTLSPQQDPGIAPSRWVWKRDEKPDVWRAWKGERQHPEIPKKLIAMLHREAVARWLLGQLFILINSLLLKERCEKSAELLTRDVALLFSPYPILFLSLHKPSQPAPITHSCSQNTTGTR